MVAAAVPLLQEPAQLQFSQPHSTAALRPGPDHALLCLPAPRRPPPPTQPQQRRQAALEAGRGSRLPSLQERWQGLVQPLRLQEQRQPAPLQPQELTLLGLQERRLQAPLPLQERRRLAPLQLLLRKRLWRRRQLQLQQRSC